MHARFDNSILLVVLLKCLPATKVSKILKMSQILLILYRKSTITAGSRISKIDSPDLMHARRHIYTFIQRNTFFRLRVNSESMSVAFLRYNKPNGFEMPVNYPIDYTLYNQKINVHSHTQFHISIVMFY